MHEHQPSWLLRPPGRLVPRAHRLVRRRVGRRLAPAPGPPPGGRRPPGRHPRHLVRRARRARLAVLHLGPAPGAAGSGRRRRAAGDPSDATRSSAEPQRADRRSAARAEHRRGPHRSGGGGGSVHAAPCPERTPLLAAGARKRGHPPRWTRDQGRESRRDPTGGDGMQRRPPAGSDERGHRQGPRWSGRRPTSLTPQMASDGQLGQRQLRRRRWCGRRTRSAGWPATTGSSGIDTSLRPMMRDQRLLVGLPLQITALEEGPVAGRILDPNPPGSNQGQCWPDRRACGSRASGPGRCWVSCALALHVHLTRRPPGRPGRPVRSGSISTKWAMGMPQVAARRRGSALKLRPGSDSSSILGPVRGRTPGRGGSTGSGPGRRPGRRAPP